jgi:5'-nucleotidase/UDP-sugar diphosphatase
VKDSCLKEIRSRLGLLILFFLVPALLPAGQTTSLLIFHTNDLHGHVSPHQDKAGFAKIAACVKAARKIRDDVLFLDAGDCVAGTPISQEFKGVPIFEVMSAMNYDASTLGNHEFDFGWAHIEQFKKAAAFPVITANAFSPDGELIADVPYKVIEVNGIRVGILGLISERTPEMIGRKGNQGIIFSNSVETARSIVPALEEKCDLVIALTHLGIEEDRKLAKQVQGIDLIIGGHSHTATAKPEREGDTYIVQAWENGKALGRLQLDVDTVLDKIVCLEGKLISSSEMPEPDPQTAEVVEKWESKIRGQYDVEIGEASRTWERFEVKVLVEEILRAKTGSDFGYYNPGGIRECIYKGKLLVRDIATVETFGNHVVIVKIKGEDIIPKRSQQWSKRWKPIDPDKVYTVATGNYVGERTPAYFGESITVQKTDALVRDSIIEYIQKNGLPDEPLRW